MKAGVGSSSTINNLRLEASPFKGKKEIIFPDIQSRTVLTRGNYQLSIINYQLMNSSFQGED
ncbi:MAG: hypothetical protein F6K48_15690 [Okeania sp. SIO3H1]|nr:hypothetical protein [Okeania sp. SIO3H1]